MTGHGLDGQIDGTVAQNDIVPALLGLSKILDDIAERLDVLPTLKDATAVDKNVVLALLGVLSLRRTLKNWLGQCSDPPRPATGRDIDSEEAWRLLR